MRVGWGAKKKEGYYTFLFTTIYDKLIGWPSPTIGSKTTTEILLYQLD
jgi:hypothetical protein